MEHFDSLEAFGVDLAEDYSYYILEVNSLNSIADAKDILSKIKCLNKDLSRHKVVIHCNYHEKEISEQQVEIMKGIMLFLSKKMFIVTFAYTGEYSESLLAIAGSVDAIALSTYGLNHHQVDSLIESCDSNDVQFIDASGIEYLNRLSKHSSVLAIQKNGLFTKIEQFKQKEFKMSA